MAARKRKLHLSEEWKEKIRAGVIMQKLMAHVEGDGSDMTATQLKAADILLKKVVPDLARTEHTGKDGDAIKIESSDVTQKILAALPQDKLESLLSEQPQDNA